jgi:hypothetical protein
LAGHSTVRRWLFSNPGFEVSVAGLGLVEGSSQLGQTVLETADLLTLLSFVQLVHEFFVHQRKLLVLALRLPGLALPRLGRVFCFCQFLLLLLIGFLVGHGLLEVVDVCLCLQKLLSEELDFLLELHCLFGEIVSLGSFGIVVVLLCLEGGLDFLEVVLQKGDFFDLAAEFLVGVGGLFHLGDIVLGLEQFALEEGRLNVYFLFLFCCIVQGILQLLYLLS